MILCEGRDEERFLIEYLNHLKNNVKTFQDCCNVINFGGIKDLNVTLSLLSKAAYFDNMKSFLIVRDAESSAKSAIQSVSSALFKIWNVKVDFSGILKRTPNGNVKVGFFLFPGLDENENFQNGTLEDLCLDLLTDDEVLKFSDEFLNHISNFKNMPFKRHHKNRLHSYFSGTNDFVGMKIGEAAQAGAFDFASMKLEILQCRILQMQED